MPGVGIVHWLHQASDAPDQVLQALLCEHLGTVEQGVLGLGSLVLHLLVLSAEWLPATCRRGGSGAGAGCSGGGCSGLGTLGGQGVGRLGGGCLGWLGGRCVPGEVLALLVSSNLQPHGHQGEKAAVPVGVVAEGCRDPAEPPPQGHSLASPS
eukprot:829243-Alexandrium_andersonii.AAC.1